MNNVTALYLLVLPVIVYLIIDSSPSKENVRQSSSQYAGNCACPEDRDRDGKKCGKRSAYSREGGQTPRCYLKDVPQDRVDREGEEK